MQHDITTPPSTNSARELLERFAMRMAYIMPRIEEMTRYISRDTAMHLRDVWEQTESSFLLLLLSAFLLRGASASAISRYIASGTADLPFRGCEQAMFDSLIASMRAAASDPDNLDTAIVELSTFIDESIQIIAQQTGISRPAICETILRSQTSE